MASADDALLHHQINNVMMEESQHNLSSQTFKLYSSTDVSTMLGHAMRTPDAPTGAPPPSVEQQEDEPRAFFKKSHTCGSLFAKCGCDDRTPLPNRANLSPEPPPSPTTKRGSTPAIATIYPKPETKRLSNPEINKTTNQQSNVIKANVYLNHPEITFPIPVEVPQDGARLQTSIDHAEIKKSNLDYHKYNVLAYESSANKDDEANKFLSDFGIFGNMGNGVTAALRYFIVFFFNNFIYLIKYVEKSYRGFKIKTQIFYQI